MSSIAATTVPEASQPAGSPQGSRSSEISGTAIPPKQPNHRAFWRAAASRPFLVLATAWPWRSLAYLATSLPVAALWALLCWPLLLLSGLPLGAVERRRLALMESAPTPSPHIPFPGPIGSPRWVKARLRETVTWQELAYGLLLLPLALVEAVTVIVLVAIPLTLLASPLLQTTGVLSPKEADMLVGAHLLPAAPWVADIVVGTVALVASAYFAMVLAAGRARLVRLMLTTGREEELDERLGEAIRSRSRLVDAFTAERRRIERDLHDGAQQRLTAVVMRLGMARTRFETDPARARALVEQAYEDARATLTELRDLVHGIHPAALTERGLAAALDELADTCPIPAGVDTEGARRMPPAIESTLYFCAAEAVNNAVRHSGADEIELFLRAVGGPRGRVLLRVSDNGAGGAVPKAGSGLAGLADRSAAYGGEVRLSSPPGGPTVVEVEIPCVS